MSLAEVLSRSGALIAFPGRVSWKHFKTPANQRIHALAHISTRARAAHIQLLVIVPNRQEDARRFVEEVGTPFHLLCDDGTVATRYGVPGHGIMTLRPDTGPALFGVNRAGTIRYRLLDDWGDPPPGLAEALAAITGDSAAAVQTNPPAGS